MSAIKENISYKYVFNSYEKENNSQLLAQTQVAKMELEDEKKALASEFKAKIDAKQSEINLLSRYVIDGYTTKSMFALKTKNFATMQWEWVNEDTGEIIKREPLVGKDRQQDIPFNEPTPEPRHPFNDLTGEVAEHDEHQAKRNEVVSPDVEDLQNDQDAEQVHEAVVMLPPPAPKQLSAGEAEPAAEATELPELPTDAAQPTTEAPVATDEDELYEKSDNEGADFNADTFNPEPPASLGKYPAKKVKATKPVATTGKKSPGRPKKA